MWGGWGEMGVDSFWLTNLGFNHNLLFSQSIPIIVIWVRDIKILFPWIYAGGKPIIESFSGWHWINTFQLWNYFSPPFVFAPSESLLLSRAASINPDAILQLFHIEYITRWCPPQCLNGERRHVLKIYGFFYIRSHFRWYAYGSYNMWPKGLFTV